MPLFKQRPMIERPMVLVEHGMIERLNHLAVHQIHCPPSAANTSSQEPVVLVNLCMLTKDPIQRRPHWVPNIIVINLYPLVISP